jgi:signal transduction histidine kinase
MMRSLRARLLLWTLSAVTVLLAGSGIFVYQAIRSALSNNFDELLVTSARTICGFVEQTPEDLKVEVDDRQVPEFQRTVRPDYFQMWREDGRVLAQSKSAQGAGLARIDGPPEQFVFRSLRLPDGRPGRGVGLSFGPKMDEDAGANAIPRRVTLVVARETAALDAEIAYVRWLLFAATGGTIVLALVTGAMVVRQGLRPLDRLAARISAIRDDDLSASVPAEGMPSEMAPVVERLNDLLRRLEAAFRRERAFSADVAHELRTPLAGVRCTLEVALTRPRAADEYRQAASECLEIVGRTQQMIDHLLALARLEEGRTAPRQEIVRLGEFVDDALRPLADAVKARGITIDNRVPADLGCAADRENLQLILANLLENAAEYTNERGLITLSAVQAGDTVEFSAANTGCRLTDEEASQVFERFWRGDKARSKTGIHFGLGLVLVQRAAAALGGAVRAHVSNGTFTVRLTLKSGFTKNEKGEKS